MKIEFWMFTTSRIGAQQNVQPIIIIIIISRIRERYGGAVCLYIYDCRRLNHNGIRLKGIVGGGGGGAVTDETAGYGRDGAPRRGRIRGGGKDVMELI